MVGISGKEGRARGRGHTQAPQLPASHVRQSDLAVGHRRFHFAGDHRIDRGDAALVRDMVDRDAGHLRQQFDAELKC